MSKCIACGNEVSRTFDGKCITCLSIAAGQQEMERLDNEHELEGLALNTPLGDNIMPILSFGQGNFGKNTAAGIKETNIVNNKGIENRVQETAEVQAVEDEVKVIKSPDLIHLVCRPHGEVRFGATIDMSKIDGSVYDIAGNNVWYFNRLFVPAQIRGRGIATKLLKALKNILDTDKITLICEVNAYGDLNKQQVTDMYKAIGFKEHPGEFLLYTPNK